MAQAFRRTIANGIAVTKTWPDGQVLSTLVHVQEGEIATWQKRGNPHLDEDGQVAIDEECVQTSEQTTPSPGAQEAHLLSVLSDLLIADYGTTLVVQGNIETIALPRTPHALTQLAQLVTFSDGPDLYRTTALNDARFAWDDTNYLSLEAIPLEPLDRVVRISSPSDNFEVVVFPPPHPGHTPQAIIVRVDRDSSRRLLWDTADTSSRHLYRKWTVVDVGPTHYIGPNESFHEEDWIVEVQGLSAIAEDIAIVWQASSPSDSLSTGVPLLVEIEVSEVLRTSKPEDRIDATARFILRHNLIDYACDRKFQPNSDYYSVEELRLWSEVVTSAYPVDVDPHRPADPDTHAQIDQRLRELSPNFEAFERLFRRPTDADKSLAMEFLQQARELDYFDPDGDEGWEIADWRRDAALGALWHRSDIN